MRRFVRGPLGAMKVLRALLAAPRSGRVCMVWLRRKMPRGVGAAHGLVLETLCKAPFAVEVVAWTVACVCSAQLA